MYVLYRIQDNKIIDIQDNEMTVVKGSTQVFLGGADRSQVGHYFNAETSAIVPPVIPNRSDKVTPLQMRKALRITGLKATFDEFLLTQPEEVQEAWEYAVEIDPHDPIVSIAAEFGNMTPEDVAALFALAKTL